MKLFLLSGALYEAVFVVVIVDVVVLIWRHCMKLLSGAWNAILMSAGALDEAAL